MSHILLCHTNPHILQPMTFIHVTKAQHPTSAACSKTAKVIVFRDADIKEHCQWRGTSCPDGKGGDKERKSPLQKAGEDAQHLRTNCGQQPERRDGCFHFLTLLVMKSLGELHWFIFLTWFKRLLTSWKRMKG